MPNVTASRPPGKFQIALFSEPLLQPDWRRLTADIRRDATQPRLSSAAEESLDLVTHKGMALRCPMIPELRVPQGRAQINVRDLAFPQHGFHVRIVPGESHAEHRSLALYVIMYSAKYAAGWIWVLQC